MKRWIILVVSILLFFSGCTNDPSFDVWYISSGTYGTMVISDYSHNYILIAYTDLSFVRSYRGALLKEGIESDDLGALQSLFGFTATYLIEGNSKQFESIYKNGEKTYRDRINYFIESTDDLSKMVNVDTLESLVAKGTTTEDIVRLYKFIQDGDYKMRLYDVGLFLNKNGTPSLLRRNIHEWSKRAIEEIEREESK